MSGELGRRAAWLLTPCLMVALTSCGDGAGEKKLELPESNGSASAAPSEQGQNPEGAPDAGVPEVTPAPEQGEKVPEDSGMWSLELPEKDPARAVGRAFTDYMAVRSEAFRTLKVDLAELSSVAMGDALTEVQTAVSALTEQKRHTVGHGWVLVEADDVAIEGATAQLSGVCFRNGSTDVDQQNVSQESPPDAYAVDASATRVAKGTWLISTVSFDDVGSC